MPLSPNLLSALVSNVQEMLCLHEPDGTYVWASPSVTDLTGYAPEDLIGKSPYDFLHPDDQERFRSAAHRQALGGQKPQKVIHRLRREDGAYAWFETLTTPLLGEHGEVGQLITSSRDVTNRIKDESRYEAIFNSMYQFIGLTMPDGTLVEVNETAVAFAGVPKEELINRPFWECHWWTISEATQAELKAAIRRAAAGEFVRYEVEVLGAEGRTVFIDFSIKPVLDDGGEVVLLIPEGRDISDKTKAVQALKASEARNRATLEALPDLVFRLSRDGVYLDVRAPSEDKLIVEQSQIIGAKVTDLMPEPLASRVMETISKTLETRQVKRLEYDIPTVDGEVRHFEARLAPAGTDEVVTVVRDLTSQNQAEAALRERTALLDSIYTNGNLPVFLVDVREDGTFVYGGHNPALERVTGLESEWLKGRTMAQWAPRIPLEDAQEIQARYQQCVEAGVPIQYEECVQIDGEDTWWLTNLGPMCDETGRVVQIIGSTTPVTELKRAMTALEVARREADQANQAKSNFLASMSHEIRTPMNGIMGFATLLQRDNRLGPKHREYVDIVVQSSERLLELINDILDLSKIEAGRIELDPSEIMLRDTVEEVLQTFAALASEKGVDLLYEIKHDVPMVVEADPTRLRQVLMNLVSNAIKFTEAGRVEVLVRSIRASEDEHVLEFAVKDTGIGIAGEERARIFESFYQVDSSSTRTHGGTGLGLAISRQLVELMGGEFGVRSKPRVGSTFSFSILARSARRQKQVRLEPKDIEIPLKGRRVLVVDDNSTNLRYLHAQLTEWEMDVEVASDGRETLSVLNEDQRFDAVLLDLNMPDMDGAALARLIRTSETSQHLPLILASSTGCDQPGEVQHLFDAIMAKPLRVEELRQELMGVFRQQRPSGPHSPVRASLSLGRILVAEDDPVNQKMLAEMLSFCGYQAEMVENGVDLLKAMERDDYDLILMDIMMPVMDGVEATREIVRRYGEDRPPIIAVTARAMHGDRETFLRAGMDDYLAKPINPEALSQMLQNWAEA